MLKICVLGVFAMELDGRSLIVGAKTPTKALDIVRALAIARNRSCALEDLYEWLWPDAEGDLAKAACDQALHRLRKLLGKSVPLMQRDCRVQLPGAAVWIDIEQWESTVRSALQPADAAGNCESRMEGALAMFTGPLVQWGRSATWTQDAAERVRSKFIELTTRLAKLYESQGAHARARATYLRALEMYPTCSRCFELLIRNRLAQRDIACAIEDYRRYERMLRVASSGELPAQSLLREVMAARVRDAHRAIGGFVCA